MMGDKVATVNHAVICKECAVVIHNKTQTFKCTICLHRVQVKYDGKVVAKPVQKRQSQIKIVRLLTGTSSDEEIVNVLKDSNLVLTDQSFELVRTYKVNTPSIAYTNSDFQYQA